LTKVKPDKSYWKQLLSVTQLDKKNESCDLLQLMNYHTSQSIFYLSFN